MTKMLISVDASTLAALPRCSLWGEAPERVTPRTSGKLSRRSHGLWRTLSLFVGVAFLPRRRALPTVPLAVFGEVGVCFVEDMPTSTVGQSRIDSRRVVAPQGVDASRHGFEVIRPHTQRVPTEMVELQALRDRPYEQLVGEAMGGNVLSRISMAERDSTVATVGNVPSPDPALAGLVDFLPEARDLVAKRIAPLFPPLVVHITPLPLDSEGVAVLNGAWCRGTLRGHREASLSGVVRAAVSAARPLSVVPHILSLGMDVPAIRNYLARIGRA